MNWYKDHTEKQLNFDEPIVGSKDGNDYILLPQVNQGDYQVVGYNWFNLTTGKYNSCSYFSTAARAVASYAEFYNVRNGNVTIS